MSEAVLSQIDEKRIRAKWTTRGDDGRAVVVNNDVAILLAEIDRLRAIVARVCKPSPM